MQLQEQGASLTTNPLVKDGEPLGLMGQVWGGTSPLSLHPGGPMLDRSFINYVPTTAQAQRVVQIPANYGATAAEALFGFAKWLYLRVLGGLAGYPVVAPTPYRPTFNTAGKVNYNVKVEPNLVQTGGQSGVIQTGPTSYQPAQVATLGSLLKGA